MIEESHPSTERVQIEVLRSMGPGRRSRLMCSMTELVLGLSRRAIRRARPGASEEELKIAFVELHYGRDLAARFRSWLDSRG